MSVNLLLDHETDPVATTAQIPIDPSPAEACDKGKIEE